MEGLCSAFGALRGGDALPFGDCKAGDQSSLSLRPRRGGGGCCITTRLDRACADVAHIHSTLAHLQVLDKSQRAVHDPIDLVDAVDQRQRVFIDVMAWRCTALKDQGAWRLTFGHLRVGRGVGDLALSDELAFAVGFEGYKMEEKLARKKKGGCCDAYIAGRGRLRPLLMDLLISLLLRVISLVRSAARRRRSELLFISSMLASSLARIFSKCSLKGGWCGGEGGRECAIE